MTHPFRSGEARERYLARYHRKSAEWPVAFETKLVDTSYGQTYVRISGAREAQPLVLLPGAALSSLSWKANIEVLAQHFCTYAVDNIYDNGRSVYTRAPKRPEDFVEWLDELFDGLGVEKKIHMMGLSYGGWLVMQYALNRPQRLSKIVLLAPPSIIKVRVQFVLRFLLSFLSPRIFKKSMYWMFADFARVDEASLIDDVIEEIEIGSRCFKPRAMVIPRVLTDEELKAIQVPAMYMVGENEQYCVAEKAVERLNRLVPHIETAVVSQAGHDLTFVRPELVCDLVIRFLG